MGVHYPKNMVGRCKAAKLVPCTIDIGAGIGFQGGITPAEQIELLGLVQRLHKDHPPDDLPAAKKREPKPEATNNAPTHDRPATGVPVSQPVGTSAKPTPKK